jgi:hypothetical protein
MDRLSAHTRAYGNFRLLARSVQADLSDRQRATLIAVDSRFSFTIRISDSFNMFAEMPRLEEPGAVCRERMTERLLAVYSGSRTRPAADDVASLL